MSVHLSIDGYHRPRDLAQTVAILSKYGGQAKVIAGGTDILPRRPGVRKAHCIQHLVDISDLDLNYIKSENRRIRIGAATTINALGAFTEFSSGPYRALSEAADAHSSPTIKNRATVGGSLCNASACADLALPLLAMDAVLLAANPNGQREIPLTDFFRGANYMALDDDELLLEIRIPCLAENTGSAFIKLRRQQTAIDMAVVNVATLNVCTRGHCETARIALGGVAPVPMRVPRAEFVLAGKKLTQKAIIAAAAAAVEEVSPIGDIRATAAYRRKMAVVLVRRALESSWQRCK
jgi:carbon-monoxide dehydrogenase medium subunit